MNRRLALLIALLLGPTAHAQQAITEGDVIVHYSAVRTTQLTPDVARNFEVRRSRNRALVVLNAQIDRGGALPEPIAASATGTVTSLLGHRQRLTLTPRQEGPVHYVMGTFETLDSEYLTLDLEVLPEGASAPIRVRWQQQFFNE